MQVDHSAEGPFRVRELGYPLNHLEPAISEQTLEYHYNKHYRGDVQQLNALLTESPLRTMRLEELIVEAEGPIFNHAAQAWNHAFYFEMLTSEPSSLPKGPLQEAVHAHFGSFEGLKHHLTQAALDLFGSGWVWLAEDEAGALKIITESNAGNPMRYGMRPLLCIDLWEHAYYLDYRNDRAAAMEALWGIVDFGVVSRRYQERDVQ